MKEAGCQREFRAIATLLLPLLAAKPRDGPLIFWSGQSAKEQAETYRGTSLEKKDLESFLDVFHDSLSCYNWEAQQNFWQTISTAFAANASRQPGFDAVVFIGKEEKHTIFQRCELPELCKAGVVPQFMVVPEVCEANSLDAAQMALGKYRLALASPEWARLLWDLCRGVSVL